MAFPIYSREQGELQVEALLTVRPEVRRKPDPEVSEDTTEALLHPNLNEVLQQAVEARPEALVADRQARLARDSATECAAGATLAGRG